MIKLSFPFVRCAINFTDDKFRSSKTNRPLQNENDESEYDILRNFFKWSLKRYKYQTQMSKDSVLKRPKFDRDQRIPGIGNKNNYWPFHKYILRISL